MFSCVNNIGTLPSRVNGLSKIGACESGRATAKGRMQKTAKTSNAAPPLYLYIYILEISTTKTTKWRQFFHSTADMNVFIRPSTAGGFATRCFPLHHLHRCRHRRCRTAIRERCAARGRGRTWCVQSHPPPVHFQFDLPIREGWPFLRWLCVQHPVQLNETQRQLTTRSHASHECVFAARISKDDDGVE